MAEDFGRLVLRLGVGGLMLFHGVHKLLTGLDPVKDLVTSHKLPAAFAYAVYFGEIVGPVLVIVGLLARFGAFLIAVEIAALVALGGLAQTIAVTPAGDYALEVEALYLAGAIAILCLGPGKLAIAKGRFQ
jgi:putative oxidoreductase